MELEEVEVVGAEKHLEVGRARWRRGASIKIGRQQTADRRTLLEADLSCRLAGQHRCTVISAGIGAQESGAGRIKHVKGHIVRVGPYAHLRIIIEAGVLE